MTMANLKYTLAVLLTLGLVSCSRKGEEARACLSLNVSTCDALADAVKSNVSQWVPLPAPEDFILTLWNGDNREVWKGKLEQWNTLNALLCGPYSVEASYGQDAGEGPGKPYFRGVHSFVLKSDTPLQSETVTVALANCVLRYEFTDAFKKCFSAWNFTISTGSQNIFNLTETVSEPIFIDAFKFTLTGTIVGQNGVTATFGPMVYEDLKPATCYLLRFDASRSGSVATLAISFDDSLEEVVVGEIELN